MSQGPRAVAFVAPWNSNRKAGRDRQEALATRTRAAGMYALRRSGVLDRMSDGFDLSRFTRSHRYRCADVHRLLRLRHAMSVRRDFDGPARSSGNERRFRFETPESIPVQDRSARDARTW